MSPAYPGGHTVWLTSIARPRRRRGPSLTQQIFIGLALGIVAGWLVSEYNPAAAIYFRPFSQLFLRLIKMIIAPLIFATLVAGIAGAGHFKASAAWACARSSTSRSSRRSRSSSACVAVNVMQARASACSLPMRPGAGDHGATRRRGTRSCCTSCPSRSSRRWPTGDVLQIVVFSIIFAHRARHDRREGPADRRLVRGAGRDDVQVHEHRHALRADRRRRGDRLHGRARRARRARRTWPGWSATLYVALAVFFLLVLAAGRADLQACRSGSSSGR